MKEGSTPFTRSLSLAKQANFSDLYYNSLMEQSFQSLNGLPFMVKGEFPELLILSGTHGDEYEVIQSVLQYVDTHYDSLPDFLFIPEVSPTAVSQKTRRNAAGHDVNRHFFNDSKDSEASTVMSVVKKYSPFKLAISFHEDLEIGSFYFYDTGRLHAKDLTDVKKSVVSLDVPLFSGTDDPSDPALGNVVRNGYISTYGNNNPKKGMFCMWALSQDVMPRSFVPEIPGMVDQDTKDALVALFFEFTLKIFHQTKKVPTYIEEPTETTYLSTHS